MCGGQNLIAPEPEVSLCPADGTTRTAEVRTMKGKEFLKRLFYGRLTPIPRELREGVAPVEPLIPLSEISDLSKFKMIYAIAEIR